MATIISESSLKKAVEEGTFIKNGIIDCAEGVKYDFRMGNYLLKAEFGIPIDMNSRSEEHTSELQSHWYISYAVFCLKKKNTKNKIKIN